MTPPKPFSPIVTHLFHEYHVAIPWFSMLLGGFCKTRQIEQYYTYDVLLYVYYVIVACVCVLVVPFVVVYPPPLVLFAPAPVLLLAVPHDVLGEAIAPLHHCWVAEPELLLRGIGGMHARAAECSR